MKKNVRVLLTVLVIIIAAVGGYFVYQDTSTTETVENEPSEETKSTTNTQISGKTLVVYYSAQNHTKDVSEKLVENLNADFLEIEPKEKYSEDDLDWTDDNSRVTKEHEDKSLRNVELKTTKVEN